MSCVGFASQRLAVTDGHMDIWLEELQVELGQALIQPSARPKWIAELRSGELMQHLDRTFACRAGFGSGANPAGASEDRRVSCCRVEDGVPQQGGRWGSDHGVLVAPELYGQYVDCRGGHADGTRIGWWRPAF